MPMPRTKGVRQRQSSHVTGRDVQEKEAVPTNKIHIKLEEQKNEVDILSYAVFFFFLYVFSFVFCSFLLEDNSMSVISLVLSIGSSNCQILRILWFSNIK